MSMDNLFTYLRFTGQNSLTYPICWYHGPSYPGTSEGGECLGSFVGEERKMYNVWDTSPCDWLAELLKRCEKENIAFWGEFTLLRLKSLMEKLTSRPDLLNALDNDTLQEGTRDWTYLYNTMNYP